MNTYVSPEDCAQYLKEPDDSMIPGLRPIGEITFAIDWGPSIDWSRVVYVKRIPPRTLRRLRRGFRRHIRYMLRRTK